MNDTTTSATERPGILVWDAPVRVFHGLMVLCFAVAWWSAESERWQWVHVTAGWTMAGLTAFRLVWGLIGSRHARFSAFVRPPAEAWRYLRSLWRGAPASHVGHNPAGAWAILGMLALTAASALSGWSTYNEWGGHAVEEVHELLAHLLLLLVGVHVAGVLVGSLAQRENLVRAMVSGRKRGPTSAALHSSRRGLALLLVVGVVAFWAWQWQGAALAAAEPAAAQMAGHGDHHGHRESDEDDDRDDRDD